MRKRFLKRGIAVLLSAVLAVPNTLPVMAGEKQEITVEGTRLEASEIPEGESVVYFGATTLSVEEKSGIYYLPLYRDGADLPEEDVTIHSMDISALYGDDYRLSGKNKTEYKNGKTILEMLMSGELTEGTEHIYDVEAATPSDYHSGTVTEYISATPSDYIVNALSGCNAAEVFNAAEEATPSEYNAVIHAASENSSEEGAATPSDMEADEEDEEEEEWSLFADEDYKASFLNSSNEGRSQLALLKEQQTGEPTRDEGSSGLSQTLADALMNQVMPEIIPQVMYSCEQKIHFDEGQDQATVELRILSDQETEGPETFTLMIVDAEKTRPYGAASVSVVINDSQQPEYSVLSLDRESYVAENGQADVIVKRTGSEYSLCTAVLKGNSTESGSETVYGEVVFMPGETEKKVRLTITKETEISLCELTAAELDESSVASAVIYPEEKLQDGDSASVDFYTDEAELTSASDSDTGDSGKREFDISFNGTTDRYDPDKKYHVVCEQGKAYGKIYDKSFDPAVEVGIYLLPNDTSHDGWFEYNKYENQVSAARSQYEDAADKRYGWLKWYDWRTWKKGAAKAVLSSEQEELNAVYYQFLTPDWTQLHTKFEGQRSDFSVTVGKEKSLKTLSGKFNRKLYPGVASAPKGDGYLQLEVKAVDRKAGLTPDTEIRLYGVACMYKRFRLTYENPTAMEFRAGKGKVSYVPLQFLVKAGAETGFARTMDIFANTDSATTTLQPTTESVEINGRNNKFGKITGYTLTINSGDIKNRVMADYPEAFFKWLDDFNPDQNSPFRFEADGKDLLKKEISKNLDQIRYDKYFLKWISSLTEKSFKDGFGEAYYQTIHIEPKIDYINVPVTVQLPYGTASASTAEAAFADADLAVGEYKDRFHAGDKLDLSVTVKDTENYRAVGYEVSTDGGSKFDSITSSSELTLEPNKSYVIRPLISEKVNGIEVKFENGAGRFLSIENDVISQDDLDDYPALKGHTYLDLNPEETNVLDRMRVVPGKVYSLNVLVTKSPSDAAKIYEPYIRHAAKNKTYNGQRYDFVGAQRPSDNLLVVGCETVSRSDMKTYTLKGAALTSLAAIRNDALGKHTNPAIGYQAVIGNGQSSREDRNTHVIQNYVTSVTGSVGEDGTFELPDITARANSRITMQFAQSEDDVQVKEVVLPAESGTVNLGAEELDYPLLAPKITSLNYQYSDPNHNINTNLTDNTILLLDDNLKLTAQVDSMGKNIRKLVFRSTNTAGATREYTAYADSTNPGVFELTTPNLLKYFNNGEKMAVYIVEEAQMKAEDGTTIKAELSYPIQQTGLSFYTRNEIIAPKTFDVDADVSACKNSSNIPLIGTAVGKEQSGKLAFNRIDWTDKKGYSLVASLDVMMRRSVPDPTFLEKREKYKEFTDSVTKAAKFQSLSKTIGVPEGDLLARNIVGNIIEGHTLTNEDVDTIRQGNEANGILNKSAKLRFDVILCMDLEFIYSNVTNQYVLATAAVTLGGSGRISKTIYYIILSHPVYLNFTGTGNINLTLGGVVDDAKNALTAGQFGQTSGNIKKILTGGRAMGQLDIAAQLKAQGGYGMCGVLGTRGFVAIGLQFQAGDNNFADQKVGFVLNGKGGLGFDFLLGSFDVQIINAAKGWGSLKNRTGVTMFNDTRPFTSGSEDEEKEFDPDAEETVEYNAYNQGIVPDESIFPAEQPQQATPGEVYTQILLNEAADHTRPELVDLGDGREFLTFLGASDSDGGNPVLYYAVRSEDGTWSAPKRVSEKTKYDLQASVLRKGDKVFIAWTTAVKDIDPEMDKKDILKKFDVVITSYDLSENTMSEDLIPLTNDAFMPSAPRLTSVGDKMYCLYALIDYAKAEEDKDYLDSSLNYSTFAYTEMDETGSPVSISNGQGSSVLEHFVSVPNEAITDPLITDFESEAITLSSEDNGSHDLLVSAFTVNGDTTGQTSEQTELYLKVEDVTGGKKQEYKPIRLTNDSVSESGPKLSKFGDRLYLTWIENCTGLRLMDVTEFLSNFFAPDTGSAAVNQSVGAAFADGSEWDWYQKTAEELGIPETIEEENASGKFIYEGSIYEDLHENVFPVQSAQLGSGSETAHSIQNYQLATDGTDLYIFYTDMCEDYNDTGVELFGLRYQTGSEEENVNSEFEKNAETGFSDAVQITDSGEVRDEISLFMNEKKEIHLVSNLFDQSINSEGEMEYSSNRLAYTLFESAGSVEIEEDSLTQPDKLIPGETSYIPLSVINRGLYPTSGFRLQVKASRDGEENVIYDDDIEAELDTNKTMSLRVPWKIPENVDGTTLTAIVSENNTSLSRSSQANVTVEDKEDLVIHDAETYIGDEGKVHVRMSVHNLGNKASAAHTVKIFNINQDGGYTPWKEKELLGAALKALDPGEEIEIDKTLNLDADDFDTFEKVELEIRVMDGEEILCNSYTSFIADQPLALVINDGETSLNLSAGESSALKISSYPEDVSAADLIFSSNNNAVATVTEAGVVQAHSAGTAVITVYDPKTGLSKTIIVTVTGGDTPTPTPDNSGSDHDRNAVSTNTIYADGSMPTEVITTGNWQLAADGTWSYLYNGSAIRGRWACIYNSYAKIDLKQKPYAWFRFDDNGIMLTGWYDDTDGNRYYLNPASDNTKGYMYTGWWLIDGKWYYFCEEQGSGRYGALLRNTTTPDGYKVGADGAWMP